MESAGSGLGIDVGSTTVKLCCLGEAEERFAILPHEGDFLGALGRLFAELGVGCGPNGVRGVVTGTEGRRRVRLPDVIAAVAIESALAALDLAPRAVVSMGGEDLVVYVLDRHRRIVSTYAGNKCASGTGEFFRQQLGRMDLALGDLETAACNAKVYKLSSRCSVFMKSDCTHRLNKGEATKGDIALSLSKVMADKVSEFLTKARIDTGQVVLTGGVTQNRFLVSFLREAWPRIDFVVPRPAAYFEAFGAAHLARREGAPLPAGDLVQGGHALAYDSYGSLAAHADKVRYAPSMRGAFDPDAEYILGIDGGSTTTKVALVHRDRLEIVASHYGRTHGDPVAALKSCLRELQGQLGGRKPRITLAATTGSSRELLGVFAETAGVYNEIIAHTVGTTFFEPTIDTLFEIGGQDAKYVFINNGVPLDYAMNEACSAGTGSFLEESAAGDLSIQSAAEIGPIALAARAPLKFGEHCSAFINSDIRKAIQQGAGREDIVAGLVFSIVANYLNRVVQNRSIGEHIALQGGVAKNPAVPLAFAAMTGKPILVPPDPELMGCFGVARLAKQKADEGLLAAGDFDLDAMLAKEICVKSTFSCKACDNLCEVKNLEVAGHRYPFGGRCSLYTNARKKRRSARDAVDYTSVRTEMLFGEFAPSPETFVARSAAVVGVPRAFSVHSLWPFYGSFFHHLGVRTVLSERVAPEGIARQESSYCFPAEIAHGAVQDILERETDYLFLPHFRDMPSMEEGRVHACTCPLTQGLPYFIRQAFGIDDERILRPVVSFKDGFAASETTFEDMAVKLGFTRADGAGAYGRAAADYQRFLQAYRDKGAALLAEIEQKPDHIYLALLGRPYNAFTRDANMGIPRKFTSQGVTVVPFDMIYDPADRILPNMYWYYGQQNMKAVRMVRRTPNLFLTWVSNFSCAPDSFMLHYVRRLMGQKPYLVLEMDSHTADAGVDTRIEAFLDIVESYRKHVTHHDLTPKPRRYSIALKKSYCDVVDGKTGERIDIRDPRVTLVWPSMGDLSVQAIAAASRRKGIRSVYLPVPDAESTQLARAVASGKECIPALLVLGSALKYFRAYPPKAGEIRLLFVPSTLGPCRTGQYYVFFDHIFEELGWENVVQLVAASENSYRELGDDVNQDIWRSVVLADYFTDIKTGIRLLARDREAGLRVFDEVWGDVLASFERGPKELDRALGRARERLSQIEKARSLDEVKKVLVVGEIYVRRDDFSVEEITGFLIERGIFPKVTGVSEWFLYTDYARKFLMREKRQRVGFFAALGGGGLKEEAWFHVEAYWKKHVEHQIHQALAPTGFIPEAPQDMAEIIGRGRTCFIEPELESEATVSSAVAAAGMADGYAGVAIIAPFGCLPGRLIEGVYAPWAKARGYPVIALENDGRPYPPNTLSRIEVFAHNVLRFEKSLPAASA